MSSTPNYYLTLTALGEDQAGIINTITTTIEQCQCLIEYSRFALLGKNFTFTLLLSGSWQAIMQVELTLSHLANQNELLVVMKRTSLELLPTLTQIKIKVTAQKSHDLITRFTQLFDSTDTNINELTSKIVLLTGNPMIELHLVAVTQSATGNELSKLKQQFDQLCQQIKAEQSYLVIQSIPFNSSGQKTPCNH